MQDIFLGLREDAGDYSITDEKTGAVKEGKYDNYKLFFGTDDVKTTKNTRSFVGYEAAEVKIKADDFEKVFGISIFDAREMEKYLLQPCQIVFNRDGGVKKVIFDK